MRSLGTSGAAGRLTLLLNHEIGAVETAMRFNSKWAVVPRYYEEDRNEPNKYDNAFRVLRSEIFKYTDWTVVDPLVYLAPFLALIKASDVSGPITGAAAVALQRIINSELLGLTTTNVEGAINKIIEEATQCKFESTSHAQDEIVLLNIVQVLGQSVDCEAGILLADDTICKAFKATFMLGDPVTKPKEYGDIMGYYSRHICAQMIRTVFGRLRDLASFEKMQAANASVGAPAPPALACKHGVKAASDILDFLIELILKDPAMGREPVEETIVFALDMVHAALLAVGPDLAHFEVLVYQIHVDLLHAMCQAAVNFTSVSIINGFCQVLLCVYTFMGSISVGQIEVVMDRVLLPLADGKNMNSIEQQEAALEGVLDMCRQPGFVHDIFANCDCRLERGDLFADMCTLLSKTAMPAAKGSPGSLQFISLEALLAIFNAIAAENRSNAFQPPSAELELPYFIDIWTPLVNGNHLDLTPLVEAGDAMAMSLGGPASMEFAKNEPREDVASVGTAASPAVARGGGGSAPGAPLSDFMRLRSVVYERHLKHKLSAAVQHFNQNHKKGFRYLQEKKLMPVLAGSALAATASPQDIASEDELSSCLGRFLHVCPGLKKDTIGELLGEGDPFYIKVLEAYTSSFDFRDIKFDAGIRLFLESFRLPGEAQKIDRIINSFGRNFYASNQSIFKSADAAYVLAYSVIMLNTDRHNGGVKNKMSLEAFRRNLRGVNECQISGKSDFPEEFLNDIYYSIIKTPLRLNESSSMDVSEQSFVELHQTSATSRGQMIHSDPGRHLFDTTMFRLIWNPAVTTICAIIDSISNEQLVHAALGGLEVVAHIAACHQLDDVADTIILNLSKTPQQVAHIASGRPETAFGKDAKMKATTLTIANIANKHGDSLQMGWTNVMDLLVCFYRQQMLPESFSKALNGDGEGGLVSSGAPVASLKVRRALAKQQAASGNSYFKTLSSMLTLPSVEPEYPERHTTANERAVADATEELLASCAWEDIFTDSKFLKQESLVHLVDAIIWASGPIPRVGGPGASAAASAGWDVSELCLELLFTVLLRNRDRIGLLWPKIFDHFQKIFGCSGDVDPALVQKAIMAMMRLCQRLLPYKADMSEALMKGIQLVSLVESQVASDMATTIAEEILNLLKGAAPFIQHQPVWVSICGLIKIIQYDDASFSLCVDTVSWVVKESLTPLNFCMVFQTVVDLLERAVPPIEVAMGLRGSRSNDMRQGHPSRIPVLLGLMMCCEEWLELWWSGVSRGKIEATCHTFKHEAWFQVVSMLCRAMKSYNVEVRSTSVSYLQRSVVAAEKLAIPAETVLQSLLKLILPMTAELVKIAGAGGATSRDCPQADLTTRELVRAVVKVVLLYADRLQQLPNFCTAWRTVLDTMGQVMTVGKSSEALTEAVPEALKNMLLVLQDKGCLKVGWKDTDGTDMWELSWEKAMLISPSLTPEHLVA